MVALNSPPEQQDDITIYHGQHRLSQIEVEKVERAFMPKLLTQFKLR